MKYYNLWLLNCEMNNFELDLISAYEDNKNIVRLFKITNNKFVTYCIWNNDKMFHVRDYITANDIYNHITNKYIEKMFIKGKGQFTERMVIK